MNHDAATSAFLKTRRKSPPLEGTESAKTSVARVSYTHDAFIDLMIAQPMISKGDLAKHFGYTLAWVSRVTNSEAFHARLAQRKSDIVDPSLIMSIEERLRAVTSQSLDIVMEKLEAAPSLDSAMKVLEMSTKALGYGARQANVAVQQNFVVAMPQKVQNAHDWAAAARGDVVSEVPSGLAGLSGG
jgi:hypothetical protein